MQDLGNGFPWVIPVAIVSIFVVGFAIVRFIMSCWKTVAPNVVAVVYGRKHGEKGYRVVKGGGFLRIPILEQVSYLPLNVLQIPVEVVNASDKNNVRISVRGVANVKVDSTDEVLALAIERFLGKSEAEIKAVAKENLEGNLRSLVGTLEVEKLISDRSSFQQAVLSDAGIDMGRIGLKIDLLNIQEIKDENGYIEALGRKQTAEILRNATIGEAEARRDADISSAAAMQAGEIAKAQADQQVSNAIREKELAAANNSALVQASKARVEIIAQAAAAEEQKKLNVAEVAAQQAKTEAEIDLQDAVRRRTEAELNATTIVEATKEKEARIIKANAEQEARIITADGAQAAAIREGEAFRIKAEKEGQGAQAKMVAEAEGRRASASANQAEAEAEAAGRKANLLADAEGIQAKGLAEAKTREAGLMAEAKGREAGLMAEAKGREALLLAEALGTERKADAFAKLDEAGRFLLIMEAMPAVISAIGDAAGKVIVPAAEAIGEGLGNVKEIRLIDLGGGGQNGKGGNILGQFVDTAPNALFGLAHKLQGMGLLPVVKDALAKAGINLDSMMQGGSPVSDPPAPNADPAEVVGKK